MEGMATYHNHVALHLRQIALFALPRSTDFEDEADDHDANSGNADRITESFDSRELDFQDGSSDADSESLNIDDDESGDESEELPRAYDIRRRPLRMADVTLLLIVLMRGIENRQERLEARQSLLGVSEEAFDTMETIAEEFSVDLALCRQMPGPQIASRFPQSAIRRYACSCGCHATFTGQYEWRRHEESNVLCWSCGVPDCGKIYRRYKKIEAHVTRDHEARGGVWHSTPQSICKVFQRRCGLCSSNFEHLEAFLDHVASHWNDPKETRTMNDWRWGGEEAVEDFGKGSEKDISKDLHNILEEVWFDSPPIIEHWSLSAFEGSPLTKLLPDGRSSKCFTGNNLANVSRFIDEFDYSLLFGIRPSNSKSFETGFYIRRDNRIRIVCRDSGHGARSSILPLDAVSIRWQRSTLELWRRYSRKVRMWATLTFRHVETLLIFRCVLFVLQALDAETPVEPKVSGLVEISESKEYFGGGFVENGALLALRVFYVSSSRIVYLESSHLNGYSKGTPLWIAFVNQHIGDSRWKSKTSETKVRLQSLKRHIFTPNYVPQTDPDGMSELEFPIASDADDFLCTIEDLAKHIKKLENKANEGDTEKTYKKQ